MTEMKRRELRERWTATREERRGGEGVSDEGVEVVIGVNITPQWPRIRLGVRKTTLDGRYDAGREDESQEKTAEDKMIVYTSI